MGTLCHEGVPIFFVSLLHKENYVAALTPMTELEAVNSMLEMIGELPVNSLTEDGISEANLAKQTLHRVNREIQKLGLHCNTDNNYPLVPDVNQEILIPSNALQVDPTDPLQNYTTRGGKLYNRDSHTFKFSSTVNVDIVFFLEFNDLPQHCKDYIATRAARQFQARNLSSDLVHSLTEKDEFEALTEFKRRELKDKDLSLLDSQNIKRVVVRRYA